MSIAGRLPAPGRGRWLTLAALAAAWVAAYWVNGWLRDRFLYDALGMARTGGLTEAITSFSRAPGAQSAHRRVWPVISSQSRSGQSGGRYEF